MDGVRRQQHRLVSLTESGDTFNGMWRLINTGLRLIAGFTFNGVPGNTTFDVVSSPDDSPGSSTGKPMSSVTGPSGLTVSALYTNQLQVGGGLFGDEYTQMQVTFGGGLLNSNAVLTFVTDTDNAVASAGITALPEAASWVMMILGVGATGAALRRVRRPMPAAMRRAF